MFNNYVVYKRNTDGSLALTYTVNNELVCLVTIPEHAVNNTTKLSFQQTVVENAEQFFAVRTIGVFAILSHGFATGI